MQERYNNRGYNKKEMSKFKRYPKIHRLGKEETEGILLGEVHVEEKIDGANAQIWYEDGQILVGSRNNTLTKGVDIHEEQGTFNGLIDYVKNHAGIRRLLSDHSGWRLYGEWLVRHTINYKETSYRKFYLFDITEIKEGDEVEAFIDRELVRRIGCMYGIDMPEYHGVFTNPTEEQLKEFVGKSTLGDVGEGIVLKNEQFIDKFGNNTYAKIVSESFKESNAVTFGGNNKHSESYWEMYITNKYMTLPRIEKIMHKIQPVINERLDLKHTPRVAGSAYHDLLTEEIWEISKKAQTIDFRVLERCCMRKAIQVYKDILSGNISVADNV